MMAAVLVSGILVNPVIIWVATFFYPAEKTNVRTDSHVAMAAIMNSSRPVVFRLRRSE